MIGVSLYLLLSLAGTETPQVLAQTSSDDPAAKGPLEVVVREYNLCGVDSCFTPVGFPGGVELRGSVHHPANMEIGVPFPLIIFLHGKHAICSNGNTSEPPLPGTMVYNWPCRCVVPQT